MNYFIFVLKASFRDFARNKIRTFLTSLGILIGVYSVVLLVAIGVGLQNFIQQQFDQLGANTLFVFPGKVLDDNGNFRAASADEAVGMSFDETDLAALQRIREIEYVAPVQTGGGNITYNQTNFFATYVYTNEEIFPVRNFEAQYGKVFSEEENSKRAKVVVLGHTVAEELFDKPARAVGKTVEMNGQNFKVVGVMKKIGGGGFGGPSFDEFAIIPYKTGFLITGQREFVNFFVRPRTEDITDRTQQKIEEALLKRYEEDEFSIARQEEILNAVSTIFSTINLVLIAISAISLLVGGIGIMNIMYVTVTERIKEIGIRRAIGARKFDILSQFIMESVILSLLGGLMAIVLAWVSVYFIQPFFPAELNVQAVVLALSVSSIIGVVFGVFPAKKAADLSPIDAIRNE
jgi:putative ABC transport system permease protein